MHHHLLYISRRSIVLSLLGTGLVGHPQLVLFSLHIVIECVVFIGQRVISDDLGGLICNLLSIVALRLLQYSLYRGDRSGAPVTLLRRFAEYGAGFLLVRLVRK